MPHQLRRIVGINLRNPKTDAPSLRIAELDPRGGILAAGENGVGKTTFLRLMPLFYGATPTQILRGTGHSSLIRHSLPDASSAVAFEYERESEEDLRCVVMHSRPDMDAPQFHIIKGGFQQKFFVDDEDEFVRREDFKARVEAMNFQVERRLFLHEWRAVVLNERVPIKEGAELRRLAAVHSLGPTSLHGLDAIAASMANERLSFRDLQSIVIDRVMDSQGEEAPKQTTKELKQNREAVTSWLETRDHLVRLRERRPDAVKLRDLCQEIKGLHHQLCALHVSAKDLQEQIAIELRDLDGAQANLRQGLADGQVAMAQRIKALEAARGEARARFEALDQHVDGVERRAADYQKMGAEQLSIEQDSEADLISQLQAAQKEFRQLDALVMGITQSYESEVAQVKEAYLGDERRVMEERTSLASNSAHQLELLRIAENEALEAIVAPARLAVLPEARQKVSLALGAHRFELKRPAASQETESEIVAAEGRAETARTEQRTADLAAVEAAKRAGTTKGESDAALAAWEDAKAVTAKARGALEEIEREMTPAKGSLLEYFRAMPGTQWHDAAKVIDREVLQRTDLAPVASLMHGTPQAAGSVAIGPVALDVTPVAIPGWVDMADLRQRQQVGQTALQQVEIKEQDAKKDAARLQKVAEEAAADNSRAAAHAEMARDGSIQAETRVRDLKEQARQERAARAAELEQLISTEEQDLKDLDQELARLSQEWADAKSRIRTDFEDQRNAAATELKAASERLDADLASAAGRRDESLVRANENRRLQLEGAGVDPERVQTLTQKIEQLTGRLNDIARSRHHVLAWRKFKAEDLAGLALAREKRAQANEQWTRAREDHDQAMRELEQLEQRIGDELIALRSRADRLSEDQVQLKALIEQGLKDFVGPASPKLSREWDAVDLGKAVQQARGQIHATTEEVNALRRTLRNLMTSVPGSVDDWVHQAEQHAMRSEFILPHEEACDKALIICQWFETGFTQPVIAVNHELRSYLDLAAIFVRSLDGFDRRVAAYNRELQTALSNIANFERFGALSVNIRSSVNEIGYLQVLREMQIQADSKVSLLRGSPANAARDFELPDDEVVGLIRRFREMLQREGGVRINLADQVHLECSLNIDAKHVVIANEDEFQARASNGNKALIMAMFLLGFAAMVRRDAPVRLTWISDEVGRYDGKNLGAFLQTLAANHVDVISAAPGADPSVIFLFKRRCLFENTGAIRTYQHHAEVSHVAH